MKNAIQLGWILLFWVFCHTPSSAQFVDHFDDARIRDWTYATGDGSVQMEFRQGAGYGSIFVDATRDRYNIWWALIKRQVSESLDLELLNRPGFELRIETRIRSSHAPRRVNLHLNTQKTTDFHTHLMEYDIPDTTNWHTISMTTNGFEAAPGDTVNAQMALMDWGKEKYRVDIDYYKVEVVDTATTKPDLGPPILYHPPVPDTDAFRETIQATEDAVVDLEYADTNFDNWHAAGGEKKIPVLTTNSTMYVILRWNLQDYAGRRISGSGLLELTPRSFQRGPSDPVELGQVRVVEILGGDPEWTDKTVTHNSFRQVKPIDKVLNSQMIIDVEITKKFDGSILITIPEPVLQRMLEGKTPGLALLPLGPVNATFYSREYRNGAFGPKLHFNIETADQ